MSKIEISKQQTDLLKGIGILFIVLHNYFHWVSPSPGENEFIFNARFTNNLLANVSSSYTSFINVVFSFFGHYGVQLFIFISGYGLAKSFTKKKPGFMLFIRQRVARIYPAFLIGIGLLILYNLVASGYIPTSTWWLQIAVKLGMVHTLLPRQALSIVGPWWFYGLIVQLYVLFIPLYYVIKKWHWKGFLALSGVAYLCIFLLYDWLLGYDVFIMANAPGHIPEFTLGILLALYPKSISKHWALILLAVVLFVVGNFYFAVFPFTFLAITYLLVLFVLKLFKHTAVGTKFIIFYGGLSMFLFAVHGFFRKPFFVNTAESYNDPLITLALGFLYLLTTTLVAYACRLGYHTLQKKTRQKSTK